MINPWKVSTIVLAGALMTTVGATMASSASADQPNMQAALTALETAKAALERASTEHGGHRVKALEATKLAIDETRAGIEWDRTHH